MTHNKYLIVLFLGDNDLISAKSAACPNVVFKSSIGFSSIKFLDWAPTSISHFFRPSVFPFVGVRPAIRLSVCLSFCLSVCLSVRLSCTISQEPYIMWPYLLVNMCGMMIHQVVVVVVFFFHLFKILVFSWVKRAKNNPK